METKKNSEKKVLLYGAPVFDADIPARGSWGQPTGWSLPKDLPGGDVCVAVPPMLGVNGRLLVRQSGVWYVEWPGFPRRIAQGCDGFPEQDGLKVESRADHQGRSVDEVLASVRSVTR